ncbi:MAG: Cys-tRNA(Pro) deacylase [Planctomycetes bacterium]|nr:Cys-tRNA(Pro) deacylase [Planctomycetota bacterium]
MKPHKTNAARLLDNAGVQYELTPYSVDESDLSAEHLAEQLGPDGERVFKTLVLQGDNGYFVCVVPVGTLLDFKKAAAVAGAKRTELLPLRDLQKITGYVRGGCSPLAMKKPFPTWLDETALLLDDIFVSAGQRGLQLRVNPVELARVVGAEFAALIR